MNGLLCVAFGSKFDGMAAHAIAYSQNYTELPFTVLTNMQQRSQKWKDTKNVNFVYFPWDASKNRQAKTTMIDYSPYDKTIYMDVDGVIQRPGIEKVFDRLDGSDIMLNIYGRWPIIIPLSYYRLAMKNIGVTAPLTVYYGAFVGFNKTDNAREFFRRWNLNWKKSGIQREMPALACTVKTTTGLKIHQTNGRDNVFSWKENKSAIIQHEYGFKYWGKFFPKGYK